MGSCEHSSVANEPLHRSPHLLTVRVVKGLLGCSSVEGSMKSHSCTDAASELLDSGRGFTGQSIIQRQSFSKVPCPFAEENMSALNVAGELSGSSQDDEICSLACTLHQSDVDCADASNGCPGGFSQNCDNSAVSLCNATEIPSVTRTRSDDKHAAIISVVPAKDLCDECKANEFCSNDSQLNGCEDLNNLSDLETDMFFSNTSFQCGDCSRGISDGCGVRSEELPTNDPINTPVKEDDSKSVSSCYVEKDAEVVGERNDVLDGIAAVGSYRQILPLHGGEVPLNFVDTGGLPSDYGQQKEQDTESVFGPTMERVTVLPEAKEDVPDREEVDFRTQIFTTDGACNSNEGIPGAVLHVTVDNADSVQFPQLNGANDKSLKYLTEENLSGHHVLCAFNSNSVIDCSAQTDSEGNDNGGFDYVSEVKRSDMICSSPRRSARISNSSQKAQTKTAVRNGRKIAKNMAYEHGIVDVFLKTARKKRTCFCKSARSSSWGLLGNVARVFGQYNALDINHVKSRGSGTARNGLRSGKQKKNHAVGSLQRPMVKIHSSTSRIRLKVKVGKEVCQNRLEVIVPEATDALPLSPATIDMPKSRLETSDEFAEIANCVEDNVQKDFAGTSQLHYASHNLDLEKTRADASIVDVQPADKDTESAVIIDSSIGNADESYFGISSQLDVEALGGISDNRYIDSGTSPDSEVINIAPDMLTGSKIEEDLRDVSLASSTVVDAHGDIKSSSLSNYNGKKGKKFDDFPQKSKCIVEKRMPGLSSKSKIRLSIKHGHKRNSGDGFSSTEIFDSIRKTASSNVSSNKDISKEILPSLSTEFGGCQGVLKVKYGAEAALDFGLNASVRSSKLQNSEKLPPSFNSNGEISRRSKSGKKSNKNSGCGSEAPGKTMSRRKDAFRLKENQTKLSKDKKAEVEEKGIAEQAACGLDDRSETGKHILDDLGKDNTDNKVASIDLFNLDMVSSGLEKQFCPPRIAWVSCDDCHKWRCIPATLADTIEETNCKWTCKDNMDKAFADCSISQVKSNAEINAELQISDASGEEDAYNSHLNSKCLEKRQLTAAQKSPWTLIKSNLFLHRNRRKQTIDEIMVCHCKPPADGRMGCGDACLNRMLNIECIRGTCPCGELCSNQQFQKRKYAKMKSFKCGKKGYGLQSQENISVGKFLIEYVGEVLDLPTYEARQKEYASRGHKHFYFMTLNGSEVIDACAKGNLGRFINHSCDPNCRTEKWMVNGEVCVGLFAVREIKKGEEVTFDYNYVRVFGAAAKKCVCGSSQCRGYIGGDPLNAEVIVQGDSDEEYPEPLMVCEDSVAGDGADTNTAEILLKNKDEVDEPADAMAQLDVDCMDNRKSTIDISDVTEVQTAGMSFSHRDKIEEHENFQKMKIVSQSKNSLEMEKDLMGKLSSEVQLQPVEISLQTEDPKSKSIHNVQEKISMEETVKKPSCSTQRLDTYSLSKVPRKLLSGSIDSKSDTLEDKGVLSKLDPLPRPSRSSSSVKKGKSTYKVLVANKPHMVALSDKKGRSISNASANARLEGVEDKLNELLDAEGGISRRKDSPRGYLKLLLLTAASGDRSNGEAIQSTRDLSMILDALLKTKSRVVLVDIINKNGLRMLHNIMKQYRRDFNKTPVLRKLLKVLEYLGMREILTSEHINGGPPCPGMESFRESILALTEHADKQVHQIARNFRDRWMPWVHRKFGCMDRDDSRIELHKGLNCNSSATNNSWHDQGVRPIEVIDNISVAGNEESCSIYGGGRSTNGATPRKRKSRWDGPADANKELNTESNLHKFDSNSNWAAEEVKGIQDDVPPGFSSMLSKTYSTITDLPQQSVSLSKWPFEIVTGRVQERFNSRLPISYGIPLLTVQQFGTPWTQTLNSWVVAPGMPFHPFPPLPPLPHDKRDTSPACAVELTTLKRPREAAFVGHNSQMDQNSPSTSGASPPDMNVQDTDNLKRMKGASYDLGRKYFKQQKLNNSKSRPPLPWKRNSCRFMGHNARSGMCNTAMGNSASNVRSMYSSEDVSNRMQSNDNTCYRHEQG